VVQLDILCLAREVEMEFERSWHEGRGKLEPARKFSLRLVNDETLLRRSGGNGQRVVA
jgi:hypothetical protein